MREEKAQERYGAHKSPRSDLGRRRKQREEEIKSKLLLGFGAETRWTRKWREGRYLSWRPSQDWDEDGRRRRDGTSSANCSDEIALTSWR